MNLQYLNVKLYEISLASPILTCFYDSVRGSGTSYFTKNMRARSKIVISASKVLKTFIDEDFFKK